MPLAAGHRFGFGGGFGGFACAGRGERDVSLAVGEGDGEAARWCERLTITRSEFRQPSSVAASALFARPLLPLPHRPRALRTLDGLALGAVVVGGGVLLIAERERLLHL